MLRQLLIAITGFTLSTLCFADSWQVVPTSTREHLRSVTHGPAGSWFCVGDKGTVMRSTNSGGTWNQQHASGVNTALYSVVTGDTTFVMAVGERSEVIYSNSGQGTWKVSSPGTDTLYACSVGSKSYDTTKLEYNAQVMMYVYHNYKKTTSYAVGTNGSFVQLEFWAEHVQDYYGGTYYQWDTTYVNKSQSSTGGVEALYCVVTLPACFAVGDNGLLFKSTNEGLAWTKKSLGSARLRTIATLSPTSMFVAGMRGAMWLTIDAGANWKNVSPRGLTENLNGAAFADANTGIVVGDNGMILRTTNAGATWVRQTVNTFANLHAVSVDTQAGYYRWIAVGDSGTIVATFVGDNPVPFTLNHPSVQIGDVPLGAKMRDTLTFTSESADSYLSVRLKSTDSLITVSPSQFIVNPLMSQSVIVTYTPTDTGARSAMLIMSHDTSWIPDTIRVTARGVQARAMFSSGVIDFGVADSAKHASFTVRNAGNTPLVISSISISNPTMFGTAVALPITIAPGDSAGIAVDLKQRSTADIAATLILKSNCATGSDTVRLVATAYHPASGIALSALPSMYAIACYPNPVSPGSIATLRFSAGNMQEVRVRVYQTDGRLVAVVQGVTNNAGEVPLHVYALPSATYLFEATNARGAAIGAGKISVR